MTNIKKSSFSKLFTSRLSKRMLIGGIIAFLMVAVFVIGAGSGNPTWGNYWRIKPLLLTPTIGILIGVVFDITQPLRNIKGWTGKLFLMLSFIGAAMGLWIGLILGLAGTMWD